jgi:hypothetical protein
MGRKKDLKAHKAMQNDNLQLYCKEILIHKAQVSTFINGDKWKIQAMDEIFLQILNENKKGWNYK